MIATRAPEILEKFLDLIFDLISKRNRQTPGPEGPVEAEAEAESRGGRSMAQQWAMGPAYRIYGIHGTVNGWEYYNY